MRRAEYVTAILLAIVSLYLMWKSGEGPEWDTEYVHWSNVGINIDGSGPGKGFWPFYLALGMLISCIWIVINAWRGKTLPSQSDEAFLDGYAKKMLLFVGGGLIGFLILIDIVSMYFAIALFMFYYLAFLGRHPLGFSVIVSSVVPFWLYLFFDIVMLSTQPKGIPAIEETIYTPAGNFFRDMPLWGIAVCFLIGGALLLLAARSAGRKSEAA